jgi:hypothetical protein
MYFTATAGGQIAVQPKISTLGIGGEVVFNVAPSWNARVGGNFMDLDFDKELEDINYDIGIDLMSFSALLDWHVFKNAFRITGGAIYNDNKATMTATPTVDVIIGDGSYTASTIGTLNASLSYKNNIAPYIGIGFGNPMNAKQRLGLTMDIGVMYAGEPDVTITETTGTVSQADLNKEAKEIEDNDYLKWYPVLGLNLFIRF